MIILNKNTTQNIYLTLTEKQLMSAPNYLFIFTNRSGDKSVSFVITNDKDISTSKERYNKFSIDVNKYFQSKLNGQYIYQVFEQTSTTNLIPDGLNELESGIMELNGTTTDYVQYTSNSNSFKIK